MATAIKIIRKYDPFNRIVIPILLNILNTHLLTTRFNKILPPALSHQDSGFPG
jgi:hypothetical protein